MKKTTQLWILVTFVALCCNSSFGQDPDGPPTPSAPVDNYITIALILACVIAFLFLSNRKKFNKTNL